jgi:excisionase family DNA binding protein
LPDSTIERRKASIRFGISSHTIKREINELRGKRDMRIGIIEKSFLGFTEAQEFLDVSHATIYRLMKQGLPSHKIGKKRVFFKEDLLQWIREH